MVILALYCYEAFLIASVLTLQLTLWKLAFYPIRNEYKHAWEGAGDKGHSAGGGGGGGRKTSNKQVCRQ